MNYDHPRERQADKNNALQIVENALAIIEKENRDPDAWERQSLARAINAIYRGAYNLAAAEARFALVPSEEREPGWQASADVPIDLFNAGVLRQAMVKVKGEPIRHSPHFGPVLLVGKS
jgi:hypothetical protein